MENNASPLKTLLGLAWPIIVSRSTQAIVGLADALMIAHLGESALASVTAGGLNAVAAFIFPMGIAFIISSFSSQLTGAGDLVAARRYGWYGLILAGVAQLVILALLPLLPWALGKLDYAPEVAAGMLAYLSIRLLSTGVVVGMESLGNYYGGMGNTSILMKANIAAMLLNIPLNWLLIDGHGGLPALGVRGAALASVLATALAFGGFLFVFLRQGKGLPKSPLHLHEFKRVLRFGLPSGLNWSFEFFAFIAFVNVVVGSLGTTTLAAWMAVLQINSISFMPAFGLATAGAILVGQAIGAGDKDSVPAKVKLTFTVMAVWQGLIGLLYFIAPKLLLGPFVAEGSDGQFLALGAGMLMLSAAWQLFDAAGITLTESLRAAGDTQVPMWVRGVLAWGVFLPGSWVTVKLYGGGELAALAWLLLYLGALAVILYFRFRSGAWRKIQLVEEAPLV